MALTTIENLKMWLGLDVSDTTYDLLLTEIVDGVSDSIEKFCDRDFDNADYTQFCFYENDLTQNLKLRNWPVGYLLGAWYGNEEILQVEFNTTTVFYQVSIDTTALTISADGSLGNQYTLSDYASTLALVTAISADYPGFTFTWADDWYKELPPFVLLPDAYNNSDQVYTNVGMSLYATTNALRVAKTGERLFRILPPSTSVSFDPWESSSFVPEGTPVCVRYNAGYTTIPNGLEVIAKKLSAGVWERSQQGSKVTTSGEEEEIGDYKIKGPSGSVLTRSSNSSPVGGLTDGLISSDIMKDLTPYRNLDLN